VRPEVPAQNSKIHTDRDFGMMSKLASESVEVGSWRVQRIDCPTLLFAQMLELWILPPPPPLISQRVSSRS
jgi:hypothetical protein